MQPLLGEAIGRLKDRFKEHRRPVDNLSNISKPTTVSEHFLTTVMITLPTTPNFIPLEFNKDSVGKAREAYLIETRDKTLEPFRYQ